MLMQRFTDRFDAGRRLGALLAAHAYREDVLVLALPRGGVPVAIEVARTLGVPLDVLVVRKVGVPGNPELAMGAIGPGGVRVMNEDVVRWLRPSRSAIDAVVAAEEKELHRRELRYRDGRPPLALAGRTAILVDDGLATGASMRAAVLVARDSGARRVIVAVPVAARDTARELRLLADDCVCVHETDYLDGVGNWYRDFSQLTDEAVAAMLDSARGPESPAASTPS
jgi:putative phosphoribosyl transferase